MNAFSTLFLSVLAITLIVRWWLAGRQIRHVRRHREAVPEAFSDRVSLAEHQKAADYTDAKTRLGQWQLLADTGILLLWLFGGGLAMLDSLWRHFELPPLATGIGMLLSMAAISSLLDLPFSVYRTFVVEVRFGFNRTTPLLFVSDHLKQFLLLAILGGSLALGVLWLMSHSGGLWWFYAWLIWLTFSLVMVWVYPVLIAPLFNRFLPLQDETLQRRIEQLLARNGLNASGIFVMDGSRRSGHGNAYFTGIGTNKRIVFFDTLLEQLTADDVEAVLAHEIGHLRRRHIRKRIVITAAISLAGLALLGWVADQSWFYAGLGAQQPSEYMALALFMLVMPVFTFVLQPALAWLSRHHEFEADDFAARQVSAHSLARALVKLYRENASTLTPDPVYSAFYDSHPPAPVRVAHLSSRAA